MRSRQEVGMEHPVIACTGRMTVQYEAYASSSSSLERMCTMIAARLRPETAASNVMPGNAPSESEEED